MRSRIPPLSGSLPLFLFSVLCLSPSVFGTDLKDGDLIFHRSTSRQSAAIAAATRSSYTHMGIIFIESGRPYVYEAVGPVKRTGFDDWVNRGKGGKFVVRRLKDPTGVDFDKVKREVKKFLYRGYDIYFDWSDSRIYCSELVWKAYQRACGLEIGELRCLKDFDLRSRAVRNLMASRYGNCVPYDMKVIAPVDMYRSQLLETVAKR